MIESKLEFILNTALAGQCALVMTQLAFSDWRKPWNLPLMLLFFGVFISEITTILQTQWFPSLLIGTVFDAPALFLAIGSLWIYTVIITSPEPSDQPKRLYWHLWPVAISLLVIIPMLLLPSDTQKTILLNDELDPEYSHIVLPIIVTYIFWVLWSAPYLISIIRHLGRYRNRLLQIHSSKHHKALTWIYVVLTLIGLFWFFSLLDILGYFDISLEVPSYIELILESLLVWTLALWGVRQTPGLTDVEFDKNINEPQNEQAPLKENIQKYQRSALDAKRSERIAGKIQRAMEADKLYQNPNLSLGMLANHLSISSHYISQTLNTQMGESFFEYINRWRALDAEKALRETTQTVLQIAYDSGFNSRSAFYNAFNKRYGCAPAAYRKLHQ